MSEEQKTPKAWARGPVMIGGMEVDCFVLEDGTALISKSKMMSLLGRQWKGTSRSHLPNFIEAKNLQPFISDDLTKMLAGIDFLDGETKKVAYHSDVLPLVCDVYLSARLAGVLSKSQLPVADLCELLIRSFAKVAITAIIWEQLGYDRVKSPEALRLLVDSYLEEEYRKWSLQFHPDFFLQLDRIYGNQRTTSRNRPKYYARFIRTYIYEPLEKGMVLEELDKRNPTNEKGNRKVRHHQFLSTEKGQKVLSAQIWQVLAAMKMAANKAKFVKNFKRLMGGSDQLDLFEDQ